MLVASKRADMFTSDCDVLVCPVNVLGTLGAGLANQFKNRITEESDAIYRTACRGSTIATTGFVSTYDKNLKKHIVFLPTKYDWRKDSSLVLIDKCLSAVADWLEWESNWSGKPYTVAIPPLGCGLGNLRWKEDVLPIVRRYCGEWTQVEYTVYYQ